MRGSAICVLAVTVGTSAYHAVPSAPDFEGELSSIRTPTSFPAQCADGTQNLFEIAEPEKLDNLMRVQDYADRFLAGASDEAGGSASGTVFGDLGVWATILGVVPQASRATKAWEAFSEVVLNTAEAFRDLLPGEMQLSVSAEPHSFEEDSEEVGTWSASAVATSEGMRLTQSVLEKLLDATLEAGLDGALDDLAFDLEPMSEQEADLWDELVENVIGEAEEAVLPQTTDAIRYLLDALGAERGPDWFDIPGGCWALTMAGGADAEAAPTADATDGQPASLLTAHLTGGALEFVGDDSPPRQFRPADVGTARLEIRTISGARRQLASSGGIGVGTTFAFGGDQSVAAARLEVLPIEIDLSPSIQRVTPGESVEFAATVDNAVDTRVRWTTSAGEFDEIIDHGGGAHAAVIFAPADRRLYPVRIEVESVSRSGLRASGVPERKAGAYLQIEDPIIRITPSGGCVSTGTRRQFHAEVLGTPNTEVTWQLEGRGGASLDDGLFVAGARSGTYTITAAWTQDPEISASVEVRVAEGCSFFAYDITGPLLFHEEGEVNAISALPGGMMRGLDRVPPDGLCFVSFNFEAPRGMGGPSGLDKEVTLVLTAAFEGGPVVGTYPVGDVEQGAASVPWRKEMAQPGFVFGDLGTGMKIDTNGLADGFTSESGTFEMTFYDGDRFEGRFDLVLREESPETLPSRKERRILNVSGHFSHGIRGAGGRFGNLSYCGN